MPSSIKPDLRGPRTRRPALAFLAAILALGAAPALAKQPEASLEIPFVLEGTGMGGGLHDGAVMIRAGTSVDMASRALIEALQAMGMNIDKPAPTVGRPVPPNRTWETDISVLPAATIDDYNRVNRATTLPTARYGLRYSGQFTVDHGRFHYVISAQLFRRGVIASKWTRVRDDRYFGNFFVARLMKMVGANLRSRSLA